MIISIVLFIPFITALYTTPLVRKCALRCKVIDKADGGPLKIHKQPVALCGGAAVAIGMMAGFLAGVIHCALDGTCLLVSEVRFSMLNIFHPQASGIILGGLLVFCTGLYDDLKPLSAKARIILHIAAGLIVLFVGIRVRCISNAWVASLLTVFYVTGAVNAFNIIDGMDGLCAGFSLISCIGFFFLGIKEGNLFLAGIASILFMSVLGFLPYNMHPAKIFLGDAGSGFLGFMCGVMAVVASSGSRSLLRFCAPIMILGIPVIDMALAISRRATRRKSFFIGDRSHIYDLLLRKGMTQPQVWGIMCVLQLALVVMGIAIFSLSS